MKITVEYKQQTPRTVDGRELEVGAVFRGKVMSAAYESLYLRTYSHIVDLADPRITWNTEGRDYELKIFDYVEHDVEIIDRGPKQ